MPTPTKWTVLFIVHAVDDQSRYYSEQLFTKLLQANGYVKKDESPEAKNKPPDVRVFILRNTYDYSDDTKTHAYLWEIKYQKDVPAKVERVFPDGFQPSQKPHDPKKKTFEDMNLNFGDPKTLQRIMNQVKDYVAKDDNGEKRNLMLFTWDHGCAFGIFDPEEYDNEKARPIKSAPSTDMLMIKELRNAIEGSFENVQMLVMMNCWMQSIETNYELKGCVDVLVGPETSIDWLGYNYISIVEKLREDSKNLVPVNELYLNGLAEFIIQQTKNMYSINKPLTDIKLDELILSTTRPGSPLLYNKNDENSENTIHGLIKKLAKLLESKVKSNINLLEIAEARGAVTELTQEFGGSGRPWCFVDILELAKKLRAQNLIDDDFVNNLNNCFKQDTPERFFVSIYNEKKKDGTITKDNFCGLSICFPNNKSFTESSFYKTFYSSKAKEPDGRISFAKNVNEWPKFIDAAIETGEIHLKQRADKNYSFSLSHDITITDPLNPIIHSKMADFMIEDVNGLVINVGKNEVSLNHFPLKFKIAVNIDKESKKARVDSLEFDDDNSFNFSIARGAGGNKTGAGGNKTGAGELIRSHALENET